jgi:hypothetical protein
MYFYSFTIISPWRGAIQFLWTNLNPLHARMICAKFGYNWSIGSGEEVENVSLQTDRQTDGQTDRQTDGRRTTGDQKSSLELSAQGWAKKRFSALLYGLLNHDQTYRDIPVYHYIPTSVFTVYILLNQYSALFCFVRQWRQQALQKK